MPKTQYSDVIVIGGGPAGTTAAALLARQGWCVTLFEQGHHPRFHIGESLLPMNLPIFDELGVLDRVRQIGQFKPGADFTVAEEGASHQSFYFNRSLRNSPTHAYQVRRSEFDQLLFENCRDAGAHIREGHKVVNVSLNTYGRSKVLVETKAGVTDLWECGYLIDASGQQTVVASQEKWKIRNPEHRSAAIFAHFSNVELRQGVDEGNISIYWFDQGWIWMIPLPDGLMSVGAVCNPAYLKDRVGSLDGFLLATLQRSPGAWARLLAAEICTEVRAASNYSYSSARQIGKGYALIGDAYAFIDPVFSSGVYIAMSSGRAIVPAASAWLKGNRARYALESWRYRRRIRKGLSAFSWFIYRFNTPAMTALFKNPRNILEVERAVTSMLAGDVFRGGIVQARLLIFKLIFVLTERFGQPSSSRVDMKY